jgi:hypothetical protein
MGSPGQSEGINRGLASQLVLVKPYQPSRRTSVALLSEFQGDNNPECLETLQHGS